MRRFFFLVYLLCQGCTSWGKFWDILSVTYPQSYYQYFPGVAIAQIAPTISGGLLSCSISPAPPAGLTFDVQSCIISGTATSSQSLTSYQITAKGANSSVFANISLRSANVTASRVYGQSGSYTTGTANNGGPSASSLNNPGIIYADGAGVYLVDFLNHRTLYYPGISTTATRVYGQGGSFTGTTANSGGLSANSLNGPASVFADSGGVYLSDVSNNRALYFIGTSTTASRVYGQGGNFTTGTINNGGLSSSSLSAPYFTCSDSSGIYVSDANNSRVLYFSGTSLAASRVYGQSGNFTSAAANNGGVLADSLNQPAGLFVDANGLYVADYGNNRVLYFTGASTTASRVYGQSGSFTSGVANNGGVTATSLNGPTAVYADSYGVYITDYFNNRVLFFSGTSITASGVYGQGTSLTSGTANNGGITAGSLNSPYGVNGDATGVYIADRMNNRMLFYPNP